MTDTKSEAREFWIQQTRGGKYGYWGSTISNNPNCVNEESDFKSALHVIEYAAYDSLRARNAELVAALEWCFPRAAHGVDHGCYKCVGITPISDGVYVCPYHKADEALAKNRGEG